MLRPLALAVALAQAPAPALTLEIRVFAGAEEVTRETRVTIHRAGDRSSALAQAEPGKGHVFTVPAGIYDAQIVRERDGRVLNIRWAERLIVMPYPDEGGRHLEVVNFSSGYGALQVRTSRPAGLPAIALFEADDRSRPIAPVAGPADGAYALFVVPAGRYDLQIGHERSKGRMNLEVPLDRTRLWVVP